MTYQELLHVLQELDPKWRRENEVTIFNYYENKFMDLRGLSTCVEGDPPFHLAVEGGP